MGFRSSTIPGTDLHMGTTENLVGAAKPRHGAFVSIGGQRIDIQKVARVETVGNSAVRKGIWVQATKTIANLSLHLGTASWAEVFVPIQLLGPNPSLG